MNKNEHVKIIDLTKIDEKNFPQQFVGCLVLTKENKILLQQRGEDWGRYPGYLVEFGGSIEKNEKPIQALIRELKEELGAAVELPDVVSMGALIEDPSYNELIHVYFWHDKEGTITGCYEGESKYFDNVDSVLTHKKITDGLRWLLLECKKKHFLK